MSMVVALCSALLAELDQAVNTAGSSDGPTLLLRRLLFFKIKKCLRTWHEKKLQNPYLAENL